MRWAAVEGDVFRESDLTDSHLAPFAEGLSRSGAREGCLDVPWVAYWPEQDLDGWRRRRCRCRRRVEEGQAAIRHRKPHRISFTAWLSAELRILSDQHEHRTQIKEYKQTSANRARETGAIFVKSECGSVLALCGYYND